MFCRMKELLLTVSTCPMSWVWLGKGCALFYSLFLAFSSLPWPLPLSQSAVRISKLTLLEQPSCLVSRCDLRHLLCGGRRCLHGQKQRPLSRWPRTVRAPNWILPLPCESLMELPTKSLFRGMIYGLGWVKRQNEQSMIFRSQAGNAWPWQREKSSLPCKRSKYDVEEGINPGPRMSFLQLLFGLWLSSAFCKLFAVFYTYTPVSLGLFVGDSFSTSVAAWGTAHFASLWKPPASPNFLESPCCFHGSLTLFPGGSSFDFGYTPRSKSLAFTSWEKLGKSQSSLNLSLLTCKKDRGQG